ncbi:MAG: leucine efflux protein LeuE [Lautropia sp.]|nr:leucine efflux protein LeuE [Lautropia sp.]
MLGITDLPTYLIGTVAVILLPGPNSMFCLAMAARQGVAAGYRAAAGILVGDGILILATILGAGTLFKLYPPVFDAIRLVGGVYLAYIGWGLLRSAVRQGRLLAARHSGSGAGAEDGQTGGNPDMPRIERHVFKRALLLSLTNPKAILFFLSFFVQFVDPAYPNPALSFAVLALILQLISFTYLNLLIFAGQRLAHAFMARRRLALVGTGLVGLLFIGFAIRMWVSAA